jgi:hypothetical protein
MSEYLVVLVTLVFRTYRIIRTAYPPVGRWAGSRAEENKLPGHTRQPSSETAKHQGHMMVG